MHETYLSEKSLSEERYHSPKAGHIPFQEQRKYPYLPMDLTAVAKPA